MATKIFISYRRVDSAYAAGRLYDRLSTKFSRENVFIDVDHIEPGKNFVESIDEAVGSCNVLVALIGPKWLDISDIKGRRLDNPDDFVRIEIGTALKRKVHVIPILIQNAPMPKMSDLPDELKHLAILNAHEIRHERFNADTEKLIRVIEKHLNIKDDESGKNIAQKDTQKDIVPAHSESVEIKKTIAQRDRQQVIALIRNQWIEQILKPSLNDTKYIEMDLEIRFDLVENVLNQNNKIHEHSKYLKTTTKQLLNEPRQSLLILGTHQSGKSTLLLELANINIAETEKDSKYPIPIILSLSSWSPFQQNFDLWLIEEINRIYCIPVKYCRKRLKNDELILFLDDLDKVEKVHREDCVKAINKFRKEHLISVTVCCNTNEYEKLTSRLNLQYAIILQPLTKEKIWELLSDENPEFLLLKDILASDNELIKFVRTPLMWKILIQTYQNQANTRMGTRDVTNILRNRFLLENQKEGKNEEKDNNYLIEDLYTHLPSARIVQINIFQIFRMADILTYPENLQVKDFYEAAMDFDRFRRTLNRKSKVDFHSLGGLKPVIGIGEKYDTFWRAVDVDFREEIMENQMRGEAKMKYPLLFIPFEVDLTNQLQQLQPETDTNIASFLRSGLKSIENIQINGRLRIYPPGSGVIKLSITLTFKESVLVEPLAQMTHRVQDLLFIDPIGNKKPCADIFLNIIGNVSRVMFKKPTYTNEERRWDPPEVTFTFRDYKNLMPEKYVKELSFLMALSPGNQENIDSLIKKIDQGLSSKDWLNDRILAVAAQGTSLIIIPSSPIKEKKDKQKMLLYWFTEARELVAAAAYAEQQFVEIIKNRKSKRQLDESYLPNSGANFKRLNRELSVMKQVFQATNSIGSHISKLKSGALVNFSRRLWAYTNPIDYQSLAESLNYILQWSEITNQMEDIRRLRLMVKDILDIESPFTPIEKSQVDNYEAKQESNERNLLSHLEKLRILLEGNNQELEEIKFYMRMIAEHRSRLKLN